MIQSNMYWSFFIILLHVLYLFFSIATYEKFLDQQHTKPIDPGDFIYASLNLHIKIIIQSINNYIFKFAHFNLCKTLDLQALTTYTLGHSFIVKLWTSKL